MFDCDSSITCYTDRRISFSAKERNAWDRNDQYVVYLEPRLLLLYYKMLTVCPKALARCHEACWILLGYRYPMMWDPLVFLRCCKRPGWPSKLMNWLEVVFRSCYCLPWENTRARVCTRAYRHRNTPTWHTYTHADTHADTHAHTHTHTHTHKPPPFRCLKCRFALTFCSWLPRQTHLCWNLHFVLFCLLKRVFCLFFIETFACFDLRYHGVYMFRTHVRSVCVRDIK